MTSARHRLRDVAIGPLARLTRSRTSTPGSSVLVIQPDHLGDILLSQPAVRIIRERFPDRKLFGVVGPWSESIARMAWPVDDVVKVEFPGFQRSAGPSSPLDPYLSLSRYAREFRKLDAGMAFVLRPDAWWAAWLASMVTNGPVVTSNDQTMTSFATHQVNIDHHAHAALRAAAIACGLNSPGQQPALDCELLPLSLESHPDGESQARDVLSQLGIDENYIVLHPGSGADVKLWPANRWRTVLRQLNDWNLPVLITGTQSESNLTEKIARNQTRAFDLAGKTPLPLLTELLRGARLVIGTDNGPLHLAVACGTPTIHLFGPSSAVRYGPWGQATRHRVVSSGWSCPGCGDLSSSRAEGCGCMLTISTAAVITEAREMLDLHAAS